MTVVHDRMVKDSGGVPPGGRTGTPADGSDIAPPLKGA